MSTSRADKALNQMRIAERRMLVASGEGHVNLAAGYAQQLNTWAFVAIAEQLDEIRRGSDVDTRDLKPVLPKDLAYDGFSVNGRRSA